MIAKEITISDAIFISIFSMAVVFIVLVSISYLIEFIAFLINKKGGRNE